MTHDRKRVDEALDDLGRWELARRAVELRMEVDKSDVARERADDARSNYWRAMSRVCELVPCRPGDVLMTINEDATLPSNSLIDLWRDDERRASRLQHRKSVKANLERRQREEDAAAGDGIWLPPELGLSRAHREYGRRLGIRLERRPRACDSRHRRRPARSRARRVQRRVRATVSPRGPDGPEPGDPEPPADLAVHRRRRS